ncbi:MAG: adenosylcobinamide-phosphate synthase CbiB [Angelakisella sp.]
MRVLVALILGFLLDLCLGDPQGLPHPVVYMGKLITALQKPLRRLFPKSKGGEQFAGVLLVVLVLLCTGAVTCGALFLANYLHPLLGFALETFWCYRILATRSLRDESMKVYSALRHGSLAEARLAVGRIVGRDTAALSEAGVVKAAVETVAENTADGIVAPMLFLALGGAPLGMLYKAINTMDSMVGYKNETYRYFGTAAARLDDVANYLPARLTAWMMIAAAWLLQLNAPNAIKIWRRDRRNHKSPNSAQTEAVCAGALGIQLAGDAYYFGKLVHKPTIGDSLRPVETEDIPRANRLLYATATLCLVLCGAVRCCIILF